MCKASCNGGTNCTPNHPWSECGPSQELFIVKYGLHFLALWEAWVINILPLKPVETGKLCLKAMEIKCT